MSKTLGSILTIGAAIAVNVIPGAGQAISAFLLGTVGLSVGTAVAVSAAITTGITLAGIQSGLGAISSIFAPGAPRPSTTESSKKVPIPSGTRAYGELRLYGAWLLYGNKTDGTPVDVWAFHAGRAHAILQVYLNDDKVTISGGVVQMLTDKRYRDNRVLAGYTLGLPTETAFAAVIAALPGVWTSDHRGDGIVTGYLIKQLTKSDKFLETYPNGDDIQMSLAGQWSLVFDPRDEAQDPYDPTTWAYSDNAFLALLHYMMTERGVDYDTQIVPQLTKVTAAADDCDDAVSLAAGGTEPRYRIALAYDATEKPADVITALRNTFDGWFCFNERNEFIPYSGRYYTPTVSIGPEQIVSYSLQDNVAAEDAVNEVLITYVSAEHDYSTVDGESWRDQDAIDASGRKPVSVPLDAQIPSPSQGRRLAKRKMARANAPQRGTVTTTYGGRIALGERYIDLRIAEGGAVLFDGVAEIVESPERDMQTGGVSFEWIAVDPNIDAWNPATEEGTSNAVADLPTIAALVAPTVVSVTPTYGQNTSVGVPGVKLTIVAEGPDREGLTWYVRTREVGGVSWLEERYPDVDPGESVTLQTNFLPLAELEVEVAYGTGDGRLSPWGSLGENTDTGDVLPDALTGLTVGSDDDQTLVTADWTTSANAQRYLVEFIVEP